MSPRPEDPSASRSAADLHGPINGSTELLRALAQFLRRPFELHRKDAIVTALDRLASGLPIRSFKNTYDTVSPAIAPPSPNAAVITNVMRPSIDTPSKVRQPSRSVSKLVNESSKAQGRPILCPRSLDRQFPA